MRDKLMEYKENASDSYDLISPSFGQTWPECWPDLLPK